jgi:hypothetical protein
MNKWLQRIWTNKSDRVTISARYRGSNFTWVRLPKPEDDVKMNFDCETYEYQINV